MNESIAVKSTEFYIITNLDILNFVNANIAVKNFILSLIEEADSAPDIVLLCFEKLLNERKSSGPKTFKKADGNVSLFVYSKKSKL